MKNFQTASFKKKLALRGCFWLILCLVVLDQITKQLCVFFLNYGEPVMISGFFNLRLLHNPGIAFSFFDGGSNLTRIVLTSFSFVFVFFASIFLYQCKHFLEKLSLSLVISGALGNGIDRLIFGYVIDFLDFHLYGWHWPTFNLADSTIFVGAFFLVMSQLFFSKEK